MSDLTQGMRVWGEFTGDRVWYAGVVQGGKDGTAHVVFECDGEKDEILTDRRWRLRETA